MINYLIALYSHTNMSTAHVPASEVYVNISLYIMNVYRSKVIIASNLNDSSPERNSISISH